MAGVEEVWAEEDVVRVEVSLESAFFVIQRCEQDERVRSHGDSIQE